MSAGPFWSYALEPTKQDTAWLSAIAVIAGKTRLAAQPDHELSTGCQRAFSRRASKSYIGEFDMISTVKDLAAEALFVSDLQPSQCPTRENVEHAVTEMILRFGCDGCAAGVAAEFGEHPDCAVARMHWVHWELTGALAPRRTPVLH
jgi:hypothetical protein